MYLFAHHDKKRDETLYREFIKRCGPESNSSGEPVTDAAREEELRHFLTYPAPYAQWYYPGPQATVDGGLRKGRFSVTYALTGPKSFEVRPGKPFTIPKIAADRDHWISMHSGPGRPDPTTPYGSSWFLDRVPQVVAVFEPEFAFADNDLGITRNLDGMDIEPQALAWPLMIFGPSMVQRIGRDKLLDAPAWKVEELPYGGIWVQVWENPFDVPQKQVTTLAKYLGLEARK